MSFTVNGEYEWGDVRLIKRIHMETVTLWLTVLGETQYEEPILKPDSSDPSQVHLPTYSRNYLNISKMGTSITPNGKLAKVIEVLVAKDASSS